MTSSPLHVSLSSSEIHGNGSNPPSAYLDTGRVDPFAFFGFLSVPYPSDSRFGRRHLPVLSEASETGPRLDEVIECGPYRSLNDPWLPSISPSSSSSVIDISALPLFCRFPFLHRRLLTRPYVSRARTAEATTLRAQRGPRFARELSSSTRGLSTSPTPFLDCSYPHPWFPPGCRL